MEEKVNPEGKDDGLILHVAKEKERLLLGRGVRSLGGEGSEAGRKNALLKGELSLSIRAEHGSEIRADYS